MAKISYKEINNQIYNNILLAVKHFGIDELAKTLGLTKRTVTRWIEKETTISVKYYIKILELLEIINALGHK